MRATAMGAAFVFWMSLCSASGCGSSNAKVCPDAGQQGCICAEGDACNPGLECRAGVCYARTGASGGATGDGGPGSGGLASGGNGGAGATGGSGGSAGCSIGVDCGGECVDPTVDPRHCGACFSPCNPGESCVDRICRPNSDCRASPCTGLTYCDPLTYTCTPGCDSSTQCTPGQTCNPTTHTCECPAGTHDCSGSCVSDADPATCGTACTPCSAPTGATPTCSAGACGFACQPGYQPCGGQCVASAAVLCGAACTPCPAPSANGIATCNLGTCGVACDPGYSACGGECVAAAGTCTTNADCCAGQVCFAGECTSTPYAPCVSSLDCPGTSFCDFSYGGHCTIDCSVTTCPLAPSGYGPATCVYDGYSSICSLACTLGCPLGAYCGYDNYCTYL